MFNFSRKNLAERRGPVHTWSSCRVVPDDDDESS